MAVFIKYGQNIYYLWSAYKLTFSKFTPTSILIDHIIEKYIDSSYEILDLGHTDPDNTGLLTYKAKFGGTHMKLFQTVISRKKVEYNKDGNFPIITQFIQQMPDAVAKMLTPLIFRLYKK